MAFDAERAEVVLFGGWKGSYPTGLRNETWTWDGTTWTQRFPAHAPPPRDSAAMAYDGVRKNVVLFSGTNYYSYCVHDTWVWDGQDWIEQTAWSGNAGPPCRYGAAAAFDAARGEFVVFGGRGWGNGVLGDTWTWNGSSWAARAPATSPIGRPWTRAAYDPNREEVVLFGGSGGSSLSYADTWAWNGTTWTPRTPETVPGPRHSHILVYDTARREMITHGGTDNAGPTFLSDTWAYRYQDNVITFNQVPDHTTVDAPFNVTPSASSGLAVTVSSDTPLICTVDGTTVALSGTPGACALRAVQAGNDSYIAAEPVVRAFDVTLPAVALRLGGLEVGEGSGPRDTTVSVLLSLDRPAPATLCVWWNTVNESAVGAVLPTIRDGSQDFTDLGNARPKLAFVGAGRTTGKLSIRVQYDTVVESDEAFTVAVQKVTVPVDGRCAPWSSHEPSVALARPAATVSILDDDVAIPRS